MILSVAEFRQRVNSGIDGLIADLQGAAWITRQEPERCAVERVPGRDRACQVDNPLPPYWQESYALHPNFGLGIN